jgi:hypothetical protein
VSLWPIIGVRAIAVRRRIRPPIAPLIIPVIPPWVMFPIVGFFDIGSHPDLNGGRARQRGIDITPGSCAENAEAQEGEEYAFHGVYSLL